MQFRILLKKNNTELIPKHPDYFIQELHLMQSDTDNTETPWLL